MKFITIRELRSNSEQLRRFLAKNKRLVLTSNGKPLALLTAVGEENLEEELMMLKRLQAMLALERIREQARQNGLDQLSPAEIEKIISRSRKSRARKRAGG